VPALFDIQGIQSRSHGERGIARYLTELAKALEAARPDIVSHFVLNPNLPAPGSIEPLGRSGKLILADRLGTPAEGIYHIGSPVELEIPLDHLWPSAFRHLRYVATLYDLIPRRFPEIYLRDPTVRRKYEVRLELIRRADRVLAISQSSADDAIVQLGIAPERVRVVGAGVSERFAPPASRARALGAARNAMPWLEPGFLLYTGGIEPRKNIDGLLHAYGDLPAKLRNEHQLVVVCRVTPQDRVALEKSLAGLDIGDRVHFPGYVPDAELILLYQSARLVVFPSFYEGFGFPVAEALACGAAVVASDTPTLAELVEDPAARFDPHDPREIRETIAEYLIDDAKLKEIAAPKLDRRFTWPAVAERTAAAYEEALRLPQRLRHRRRPRVAFVSPFPPQRSGVADESYRLVSALAEYCEVDAFADGPEEIEAYAPEGVPLKTIQQFDVTDRGIAGYDRVFYCIGNSEFHTGALSLLRRRPGVVIAHDVRLNNLYAWCGRGRAESDPESFPEVLHSMYRGRLPEDLGRQGAVSLEDADRHGVFMARETLARAERYLVHSNHAAQLARLEAAPGDEGKISVIPFGVMSPDEFQLTRAHEGARVIASFGLVSPAKQTAKVVDAFPYVLAKTEATLAIVGPQTPSERKQLARRAALLGVPGRLFRQTGYVDEERLLEWATRTAVAVQLRASSNGETSAMVARCLAAGVPTIVTNIGSAAELPDECVVKVERDVTPQSLGETIAELLDDANRRASMAAAGVEYSRERSYARVASKLYEDVVLAKVRSG
jgi:glycosyltransferase involved in cell wall biosynthesis